MSSGSDYADELERAKARHAEKSLSMRLTMRARRLLGLAGWSATEKQLRAAAAEMSKVDQYKPADLDAAIARALEIQNDESERGRRVRPEEVEQMAKQKMDAETRDKVREYARKRRVQEPGVKATVVLAEVREKFSVEFSDANWYSSYWGPLSRQLKKNGNGKAPEAEAARKDEALQAEPPKAEKAAAPAPVAEKKPEASVAPTPTAPAKPPREIPVAAGGPYLSFMPLTNGQTRVSLDVMVDPAGAAVLMQLIGQGFSIINRPAR